MQQDDWNTLFLGVIAGYFLVMTVALIWVAFVVRRGVREVSAVASDVRLKIDPVLARVREIADDVEGMSATARREVERLGSTAERVSNRVDEMVALAAAVQEEVREQLLKSVATVAGLRRVVGRLF
jgi:methyl-accepting chemotaxis protein